MPLKTEEDFVAPHPQLEQLKTLVSDIQNYVVEEQWQELAMALNLRQQCLETLWSEAALEHGFFKSLGDLILEQDAVLVASIQEQKKTVEKQLLELGKARRAIQAYSSR